MSLLLIYTQGFKKLIKAIIHQGGYQGMSWCNNNIWCWDEHDITHRWTYYFQPPFTQEDDRIAITDRTALTAPNCQSRTIPRTLNGDRVVSSNGSLINLTIFFLIKSIENFNLTKLKLRHIHFNILFLALQNTPSPCNGRSSAKGIIFMIIFFLSFFRHVVPC